MNKPSSVCAKWKQLLNRRRQYKKKPNTHRIWLFVWLCISKVRKISPRKNGPNEKVALLFYRLVIECNRESIIDDRNVTNINLRCSSVFKLLLLHRFRARCVYRYFGSISKSNTRWLREREKEPSVRFSSTIRCRDFCDNLSLSRSSVPRSTLDTILSFSFVYIQKLLIAVGHRRFFALPFDHFHVRATISKRRSNNNKYRIHNNIRETFQCMLKT